MQRRRLVRVPASSANLGPGFDVFAAALALHVELEVLPFCTANVANVPELRTTSRPPTAAARESPAATVRHGVVWLPHVGVSRPAVDT